MIWVGQHIAYFVPHAPLLILSDLSDPFSLCYIDFKIPENVTCDKMYDDYSNKILTILYIHIFVDAYICQCQ